MKNTLFILILLFFSFCNQKKDELHINKAIEKPINHIHSLYSDYGIMFVKIENDMIASTDSNHLERFYKRYFLDKYQTFEYFISDALEQKIVFDRVKFKGRNINIFSLDKNIENEYENFGISYLLNKYCSEGKGGYIFKNLNLSDDKSYTIMYYLFMDGSRISFDDVGGFYTIKT